jgi:hypothetical protein
MQRGEEASTADESDVEATPGGAQREFDWRGWTLVGAIVVAFLVVPALILYLPAARDLIRSLGLTVRDAYLVLPLLPAFGLGAIAVWSAIRMRSA